MMALEISSGLEDQDLNSDSYPMQVPGVKSCAAHIRRQLALELLCHSRQGPRHLTHAQENPCKTNGYSKEIYSLRLWEILTAEETYWDGRDARLVR